jgi:hypothetical protein
VIENISGLEVIQLAEKNIEELPNEGGKVFNGSYKVQ